MNCQTSLSQAGELFASLYFMKGQTPPILMTLTLPSLAVFLQKAQAVSPPPDGGYQGGNKAEGMNALFDLTSGLYKTAVGFCHSGVTQRHPQIANNR